MKGESEEKLVHALRRLGAETSGLEAGPHVRAALLKQFAQRPGRRILAWPLAAAACLLAGFAIGVVQLRKGPGGPEPAAERPIATAEPAAPAGNPGQLAMAAEPAAKVPAAPRIQRATAGPTETALTPWYFEPGLPAPATARVIRVEVPPETAARYGVAGSGPGFDAEILIGDDGLARAIRFLRRDSGRASLHRVTTVY
jgi:hypothetical protein